MAIDILEAQQLAGAALGLDDSQLDEVLNDEEALDRMLKKRFGVKLDTFAVIARALLPLTPVVNINTDDRAYHAFVAHSNGRQITITKLALVCHHT